jgi:hypothetical protein
VTTAPTIAGDRSLPPPFDHPLASARARAIAERGTVLRAREKDPVLLTPRMLGASLGTGPIRLEPVFVTGVARVPAGLSTDATVPFEQYQRHTAWDRPGGTANRSGAGDLDVVVCSARTRARLALGGNPTVLLLLFVPDEEVVVRDAAGAELVAHADRFVPRVAADRFLGYLRAQRAARTGEVGAHPNRPELVAAHGLDVKVAMHALRLGLQGVELLTTGRITLPVPEPDRSYLPGCAWARCRWRGWSRRSRTPRRGCSRCGTAPRCRPHPTPPGWTAGCAARTWRTGGPVETARAPAAGSGRGPRRVVEVSPRSSRARGRSGSPSRCRGPPSPSTHHRERSGSAAPR